MANISALLDEKPRQYFVVEVSVFTFKHFDTSMVLKSPCSQSRCAEIYDLSIIN